MIFLNPKAKEAFFVRSFTRRVKNEAAKSEQRIKLAMEVGVRSLPAFIWTLGITKLAAAHLNGFLLARGPSWPFVVVNNLAKATVARLHLQIYHYLVATQFTQYLYK